MFRVALKSVPEWRLKWLNPMISRVSSVLSGRSGRPLALYSPHVGLVAHGTAFGVSALSGDDRFRKGRGVAERGIDFNGQHVAKSEYRQKHEDQNPWPGAVKAGSGIV